MTAGGILWARAVGLPETECKIIDWKQTDMKYMAVITKELASASFLSGIPVEPESHPAGGLCQGLPGSRFSKSLYEVFQHRP